MMKKNFTLKIKKEVELAKRNLQIVLALILGGNEAVGMADVLTKPRVFAEQYRNSAKLKSEPYQILKV